jgi:DDB1- and CUL4-associated factor 11
MVSPHAFDEMDLRPYTHNFDYRFTPYNQEDYIPNPDDCSVVTYRGHSVLKTLIRCHFSPPGSSNSRYVYSGSEDGKVWIWNIDGTVQGEIDVAEATRGSRPRQPEGMTYGYELHNRHGAGWKTCVRDASWHPNASVIAGKRFPSLQLGTILTFFFCSNFLERLGYGDWHGVYTFLE